MRIGILGSGLMGGTLGTIFARTGHEVVFSYSHRERKLKRLAHPCSVTFWSPSRDLWLQPQRVDER